MNTQKLLTGTFLAGLLAVFAPGCGAYDPEYVDSETMNEEEDIAIASDALVSSSTAQMEWSMGSSSQLHGGSWMRLINTYYGRLLKYGSREYGINLVWADSVSSPNIRFDLPGGSTSTVRVGDRVAIYVSGGGYLKYGSREYGINLVWSSTPVYEWEIRGGTTGDPVYGNVAHGLYNRTIGQYVVYCSRSYGINLKWANDCTRCATYNGCSGGGGGSTTITECGIGTCPSGYHDVSYSYSSSCGGNGLYDNQTTCATNTGSVFSMCGTGNCPSGYHATSNQYSTGCDLGGYGDNQTTCAQNSTTSFWACGSCPSGYTAEGYMNNPSCSGSGNNYAYCVSN